MDVLGWASSATASMRFLRCTSCERVWRDDYWYAGHPPRGWVKALGIHLAALQEEAADACY